MIPDDVVRLPAGWYPDPTGLPQLRWWDNHAWTQHTTAARQPLIVQESPLAWADDMPTRRERREREREDRGTDDLTPPTAQSLLELDPPLESDEPVDVPAPEAAQPRNADDLDDDPSGYAPLSASGHAGRIPSVPPLGEDGDTAGAPVTALTVTEEPVVAPPAFAASAEAPTSAAASVTVPDVRTSPITTPSGTIPVVPMSAASVPAPSAAQARSAPASFSPAEPFGTQTVGTPLFDQVAASAAGLAAPQPAGQTRGARARVQQAQHPSVGANGLVPVPISTAPVWVIALFPLLQLVVMLLLVTGLGSNATPELLMPVLLFVVYLAMVALAIADVRLLRRNGIEDPAHWWWALLTAPVYLFVRAMVLTRKTGRGFGPMLVWFALALLSIASVLAVPGMLITSVPAVFSAQAEQSITADAAANGATLDVSCPVTPPILVGQTFSCTGTGNGRSFQVEVSLQRVNGWIDWRVDDWGVNTLSR